MNRREAVKALTELPEVASIAVSNLKPTDVLVVECNSLLSQEQCDRIMATVKAVFPGHQVLVFDKDLRLKVQRSM